ncbi:MAG: bifunctional 4-hydroxy-3-methylbut-2-enyl diphosphate reductase/30S ribosomal protein S1 [Oscillospiraceae bacterium]|nr:bifunctional 4-hydroxy-3-methylbut-2-enyl diphosphate reductase/30S ribosomal protein S1 [Oscillospiraceae bacterium]
MAAIILAKHAGFCPGVARAVNLVEEALVRGEKLQTLGPLIHNDQVIEQLKQAGVTVIENLAEAQPNRRVVIRAHGEGQATYQKLADLGLGYLDATCPYVAKIHKIVQREEREDREVIVFGDPAHPEVIGICGHCKGRTHVVQTADELARMLEKAKSSVEKSYILVAQTTAKLDEWQKCAKLMEKQWTCGSLFGTICNATHLRQNESANLSRQCDAMVVVGGRKSSNTAKLVEVCKLSAPTFWVERASELLPKDFARTETVGITAGASTPSFIIKEVQRRMSEILGAQQEEMSFEEMLEQSFKTIYTKEKVTAIVTSISGNEIAVDIGTKHAGYVPLHEFTDDPNAKLEELVKVGDSLELTVLRVNDVEGTAMLSKKRLDAAAGFEKVADAEEKGEILEGMVVDVVKGGVIALYSGVRVFIPASQATVSRGQELEPLLKTKVRFKILETNRQRRRAVGSIRAVLKEERKGQEEAFWNTVEIGKAYDGVVKSLTGYGAFVDLGGVDGMVHISELSWNRIKDPSEVVSAGQKLEVFIKDIDRENKKISLGHKKDNENPWEMLGKQYKTGDATMVKIVSMTPFGAFAQVIPGVDGLIHISQISNNRIGKPADVLSIGQEVQAKITDIDMDRKRVSLSIRALLTEEEQSAEETAAEEPPLVMEFGPPEE